MKKKPYPLTDLTGGLNVAKDPVFLLDTESPNILCARIDKGLVKKDMGWYAFGAPLLGIPMLIDTFYKSDGVYRVLCLTTTSAYRYSATLSDWYDITEGVEVTDCETKWTESGANITCSADTTYYKKGSKSSKIAIGADFTTGLAAYYAISSADYTGHDHVHLWVRSSVALASGDISLLLDNTAACASPLEDINIPALAANTWTRVSLTYASAAGLGAVISVGLKVNVDKGACDIYLDDIRSVKEFTGTILDPFSTCSFMDYYIITNYKDTMKKYNGAPDYLATLGGTPPKAKSVVAFMNRLVVAFTNEVGTDYPLRIKWSDVGTIETWTASNYLEAADTYDFCCALQTLGSKCYLYKDTNIWELLYVGGTAAFQLKKKIDQVSTQAISTLQRVRDSAIFFAYDGIYTFDQAQVLCMTDKIYPLLFRTGDKIANLAAVQAFNATYVEELREYWLSISTEHDNTPSTMFKFNIETKSWIRRNDLHITCMGYYERLAAADTWTSVTPTWATITGSWGGRTLPANAATTLLGDSDGQIWEDDRYTYTSDEFLFETKDFMFGHACRVVDCRVESRYGGFSLYYSIDGGSSWTLGDTFAYTPVWLEHSLPLNLTAQRIRFKITTSELSFELKWIEPWYLERVRSISLTT